MAPSTAYTYVVRAFNSQNYADSEVASATTGVQELEMPENLTAKAGRGIINLMWTDTNAGESGYKVLRSEGGPATVIATLPANSTKYADTTVVKGITYQYQVQAVSENGPGPVSSAVSVTAR